MRKPSKSELKTATPTELIDGEQPKWVESKLQQQRPQIAVTSNASHTQHDTPTSSVQESNKLFVDPAPHYDTPSNIPVRGKECAVQEKVEVIRSLSPPPNNAKNYRTGVREGREGGVGGRE